MFDLFRGLDLVMLDNIRMITDAFMSTLEFTFGLAFYVIAYLCIRKKPVLISYIIGSLLILARLAMLLYQGKGIYVIFVPIAALMMMYLECGILRARSRAFKYLDAAKTWDLRRIDAVENAWDYFIKNINTKKKDFHITLYDGLPVTFKEIGSTNSTTIRFAYKDELKKKADKENRRVRLESITLNNDEIHHIRVIMSRRLKKLRKVAQKAY